MSPKEQPEPADEKTHQRHGMIEDRPPSEEIALAKADAGGRTLVKPSVKHIKFSPDFRDAEFLPAVSYRFAKDVDDFVAAVTGVTVPRPPSRR